jgi:DME family drug/metabolite transporter
VLATLVCVVGLVLRSWDVLAAGLGEGAPAGLGLALAAGASSAAWTTAAKHQLDRGVAPLELTTASFALGGLLLIPVLLGQPLDWVLQPTGLALALYLGVATFAIANLILGYGLAGLTPGPATTLMLSDPLVATLLGVAVLGETLDAAAWLGLALVLAGLALQGLSLARERPADAGPVPAPTL